MDYYQGVQIKTVVHLYIQYKDIYNIIMHTPSLHMQMHN